MHGASSPPPFPAPPPPGDDEAIVLPTRHTSSGQQARRLTASAARAPYSPPPQPLHGGGGGAEIIRMSVTHHPVLTPDVLQPSVDVVDLCEQRPPTPGTSSPSDHQFGLESLQLTPVISPATIGSSSSSSSSPTVGSLSPLQRRRQRAGTPVDDDASDSSDPDGDSSQEYEIEPLDPVGTTSFYYSPYPERFSSALSPAVQHPSTSTPPSPSPSRCLLPPSPYAGESLPSDSSVDDQAPAYLLPPRQQYPREPAQSSLADVSLNSELTPLRPSSLLRRGRAERTVVLEGWLYKLGVVTIPGFEWKKRWFTLWTDCTLAWSRTQRRRRTRGHIDLRYAELPDERLFNSSFDLAITFVIATTTRIYFLKEPEAELHCPTKTDWVRAISALLASRLLSQISENSVRLTDVLAEPPAESAPLATHERHRGYLETLNSTVNALHRELAAAPENWTTINQMVRGRFASSIGSILGDGLYEANPNRPNNARRFALFSSEPAVRTLWDLFRTARDRSKMGSSWDKDLADSIAWVESDYRNMGNTSTMFRSLVCHALNERKLTVWLTVLLTAPKIAAFYQNPDSFFNSPSARRGLFDVLGRIALFHFQLDIGFEFHQTVLPSRAHNSLDSERPTI